MIVGFKRFETAFLPHRESFILIGGTAVQMVLGQYDSAKEKAATGRRRGDFFGVRFLYIFFLQKKKTNTTATAATIKIETGLRQPEKRKSE